MIQQDVLSVPGMLVREVVWALTGTYTDKKCAICLRKLQNQQFFRQQALPGKAKFSSSAASDLKISKRLLQ